MFVDEIVSDGVFASTDTCDVVSESSYSGIRDAVELPPQMPINIVDVLSG